MRTKKFSYPPFYAGISLLLVIFLILCMVIFAVLSLAGATKDYQASKTNALQKKAYYEACNKAEEIRAELADETHTEAEIAYTVPIDEDERLRVVLGRSDTGTYEIITWVRESTQDWTGEQTLPVLGSD